MKMRYFFWLLILLFFSGCMSGIGNVSPLNNGIVMTEGMKITASNNVGTITIKAGSGFERSYTWEGDTRSVVMWPRKERWGGKLGLYFPGSGNHWKEHNRITRAVLEEAERNFNSMEEVVLFVNDSTRKNYTVYRDDGLVVTWHKAIKPSPGAGSTLFVNVWQLYINEKKPTKILGSQNDKIIVEIQ
ncbi:MAG: hypothetical protein KJ822_20135 [Proteobacteria bacterium]|nr:hypothetical protein [Pseudomonadota bacterium]